MKDEVLPAAEALARLGLEPLVLGPKEGLALINGTQASTAIALDVLFTAERIFGAALVGGAMSVDALKGTDAAFDPRIHEARGQPGQIAVAASSGGCSTTARSGIRTPNATRCRIPTASAASRR